MLGMKRFIFSSYERNVLLKLIVQHHHILGCKENRTEVVKGKGLAWMDITEKYNATEGVRRCDVKQLRKCWENIKARSRRMAEENNLSQEQMREQINGTTSSNAATSFSENSERISEISDDVMSETVDFSNFPDKLNYVDHNQEIYPECSTGASEENDPDKQVPTVTSNFDLQQLEEERLAIKQAVALIRPNRRKRPNPESREKPEEPPERSDVPPSLIDFHQAESDFVPVDQVEMHHSINLKLQEHEAKLAKLKYEQECLEEEHCAKMELIAIKTSYYKEKIKRLKTSMN